MSQQVKVNRDLVFEGSSASRDNVVGNISNEKQVIIDEFTWVDTNFWTSTLDGTSDAVAATAAGYLGLTMTTGTVDNEVSYLGSPLIFLAANEPVIETTTDITDVSGTFEYFGFSDANTETSPHATIDADGGTLTAVATNACGFVIDADLGSSSLWCASVNAGGAVQSVDSGTDWTDGVKHTLRVELDADGNAKFYMDGVQVGTILLAMATTTPLCAIYNYGTRANDGANTVMVRRFKAWQNVTA